MAHVSFQHRALYRPRPISRDTFRRLVESLEQFKPGLETQSRTIRAQAISFGNKTDREGPGAWEVIEPYAFEKLEQIQFELLLTKSEQFSCELHVDFRKERIFLSVSDIGTGWGQSVFDDMRNLLAEHGISVSRWSTYLERSYALIESTSRLLLVGALILYVHWRESNSTALLAAFAGLLVGGAVPALRRAYRVFVPMKQLAIIEVFGKAPARIPWAEIAAVLGVVQGAIWLLKELIEVLGK